MNGSNSFGLKWMIGLFAASIIAIASSGAAPGGRFDALSKIVRKNPAFLNSGSGSSSTTTTTTANSGSTITSTSGSTTTAATSTNALYAESTAVPSEFDPATLLQPTCNYTGGTLGCLPSSNSPDVVGAFRFMCNAGQVLRDDPIVFPGQPGKSHLHQFYGNLSANGNSTYASLRSSGGSSCEGFGPTAVNRSAYWMPAMLDGKGNVVRPDYVAIYYKRVPLSSPYCKRAPIGDPSRGMGDCVPLPNGLRFIAGYDMVTNTPQTNVAYFNCDGQTAQPGHYATMPEAAAHCPTAQNPDGTYNRLGAVISMPDCWDGVHLDMPDHRSHLAQGSYGWWGYYRCDDGHPFLLPTFTMGVWYMVDQNLGTWHLSSDEMHPELPAGSTFHADWFGAWDNKVEAVWTDNCINKKLNCAGGDLGNGTGMRQSGVWKAEPRLVPIPG